MIDIQKRIEQVEAEFRRASFASVLDLRQWVTDRLERLQLAAMCNANGAREPTAEERKLRAERDKYLDLLNVLVVLLGVTESDDTAHGQTTSSRVEERVAHLKTTHDKLSRLAGELQGARAACALDRVTWELHRLQRVEREHADLYVAAVKDKRAAQIERDEARKRLAALAAREQQIWLTGPDGGTPEPSDFSAQATDQAGGFTSTHPEMAAGEGAAPRAYASHPQARPQDNAAALLAGLRARLGGDTEIGKLAHITSILEHRTRK